jgi:hypothetical protein
MRDNIHQISIFRVEEGCNKENTYGSMRTF